MKGLIVAIGISLFMFGCTDSQMKNITTLGTPGKIELYSGGKKVAEWHSTGKITSESSTDGWKFVDRDTGKLVRVSGTTVVIN